MQNTVSDINNCIVCLARIAIELSFSMEQQYRFNRMMNIVQNLNGSEISTKCYRFQNRNVRRKTA